MSEKNFTIIRLSGRTEFITDRNYFEVLSNVSHEYRSAGANWDRPNMLLLNGKIVVPEGLSKIAWEYGERNRELHENIHKKIREEFWPDWLEKKP